VATWPSAPTQLTFTANLEVPPRNKGSIWDMVTNISSINGFGVMGPDSFETCVILAVETDLIARTEQTEILPGAKKHKLTS
jgi:hypothetical protein